MSRSRDGLLATGAAIVVVAVLVLGFRLLGPPRNQRDISADERRVQDLRTIAQQIFNRHSLPANLAELKLGAAAEDRLRTLRTNFTQNRERHTSSARLLLPRARRATRNTLVPTHFGATPKGASVSSWMRRRRRLGRTVAT